MADAVDDDDDDIDMLMTTSGISLWRYLSMGGINAR